MPITKALEFDQTANKLLFQIGEEAKQQRALQQKLEQDDARRRAEAFNSISPDALNQKLEKEVVYADLDNLVKETTEWKIKNQNAPIPDIINYVNGKLSDSYTRSAKVKSAKDNVKSFADNLSSNKMYDIATVEAVLRDRVLFETDTFGNKTLKQGEKIDDSPENLIKILKSEPEKFISKEYGAKTLNDKIKNAAQFEEDVTTEVDTPSGRQTIVTGKRTKIPSFLQSYGNNKIGVKLQPNGYIDEDVFQEFYQDPSIAVYIDANAKDIMKRGNVPESPEAMEYFKRSFLTDFLERNKEGAIKLVDKKLYAKAPSAGITVNIGGAQPYRKGYEELYKDVKANKFSETSPSIIKYLLSVADSEGKRKAAGLKYSKSDIDVRIVGDKLKLFDKKTNEEIATFNERDFDQQYNRAEFSPQAAGNASGVSWN